MTTWYGWMPDLVVIDCLMSDETFWLSDPMPRWVALFVVNDIAIWGNSPVEGKTVRELILIPRERWVH